MSNVDVMLKMLFESDQAVADVFNIVFGEGRKLIDVSMLRPASEREIDLVQEANGRWMGKERTCDVARRIQWNDADSDNYLLLCIENQLNPHLLMPWRVKEMHDMSYGHQVRDARELFRSAGRPADGVEFLSGVDRGFLFRRIVTIVIYWGEEPWEVPRQFADMLMPVPVPELRTFEPRLVYPLLIASEIPEKMLDGREHELSFVLNYMSASKDMGRLEELLRRNPAFRALPRNLALGLLELTGCQYREDNKQETINMCKAIEDMKKQSEEKGRMEGEAKGRIEGEAKGRIEGEAKGRMEGEATGEKRGSEMTAREFVSYLREQSFPEDKIQDFLVQRMKYSPEQIADLCAGQ